ncbi:MAG TPA: GAF domain-containing protein, partial [Burkholderiales bacterium]|nr:GAF domain-containing protein [Burkholderiales bacterium]
RAYLNTSAEPRFGDNGEFIGYRGVTCNITKRKFAEQHILRLGRMYAALSATNEAILHAQSPEDLYQKVCDAAVHGVQKVCDAAVHGGMFRSTIVATIEPRTDWVRVIASTGLNAESLRTIRASIDESVPEGHGMIGTAFRSRLPAICNNYFTDPRMAPWREAATSIGVAATAAVPLVQRGDVTGVLAFYSGDVDAFDAEIVKLLERMAENVAHALDNFERTQEQQRADQALRESEARFKSLTELSSDWYWEQDAQYRFTRFDGRYVERSRGAFERLVGSRPWECGLENAPGREIEQSHRRVLEQRQPFHNAVVYAKLANDERICMSISGTPIFDAQGEFMGYRGTGRDITAR